VLKAEEERKVEAIVEAEKTASITAVILDDKDESEKSGSSEEEAMVEDFLPTQDAVSLMKTPDVSGLKKVKEATPKKELPDDGVEENSDQVDEDAGDKLGEKVHRAPKRECTPAERARAGELWQIVRDYIKKRLSTSDNAMGLLRENALFVLDNVDDNITDAEVEKMDAKELRKIRKREKKQVNSLLKQLEKHEKQIDKARFKLEQKRKKMALDKEYTEMHTESELERQETLINEIKEAEFALEEFHQNKSASPAEDACEESKSKNILLKQVIEKNAGLIASLRHGMKSLDEIMKEADIEDYSDSDDAGSQWSSDSSVDRASKTSDKSDSEVDTIVVARLQATYMGTRHKLMASINMIQHNKIKIAGLKAEIEQAKDEKCGVVLRDEEKEMAEAVQKLRTHFSGEKDRLISRIAEETKEIAEAEVNFEKLKNPISSLADSKPGNTPDASGWGWFGWGASETKEAEPEIVPAIPEEEKESEMIAPLQEKEVSGDQKMTEIFAALYE
jgi:hypothetical protein